MEQTTDSDEAQTTTEAVEADSETSVTRQSVQGSAKYTVDIPSEKVEKIHRAQGSGRKFAATVAEKYAEADLDIRAGIGGFEVFTRKVDTLEVDNGTVRYEAIVQF